MEEAKKIAAEVKSKITIKQLKEVDKVEIQADSLRKVVKYALTTLKKQGFDNFFLEDAGLFINQLNGFPGVFSHYVYYKLWNNGILKLIQESKERKATFRSVVGLVREKEMQLFEGHVTGKITYKIRGARGFGFDPIFKPKQVEQTFGEMKRSQKNKYSHRKKSLVKMIKSTLL